MLRSFLFAGLIALGLAAIAMAEFVPREREPGAVIVRPGEPATFLKCAPEAIELSRRGRDVPWVDHTDTPGSPNFIWVYGPHPKVFVYDLGRRVRIHSSRRVLFHGCAA